jgi:RNA polymerase sigma factor (sigma-70 family)
MKASFTLTKEQQKTVLDNVSLIFYTSQRYRHIPVTAYEDLTSRLYYRLCAAVSQFDPSRGLEISTYLVKSLQGEMKNYFRDEIWMIKPPRSKREKSFVEPTQDDGDSAKANAVIQSCAMPISLDSYIDYGDSEFRADVIPSDESVENRVVDSIGGREILRILFLHLHPSERVILALKMRGKPAAEIQSRFLVSRSIALEAWEELRLKVMQMFLSINEGEDVESSKGSRALGRAYASKFVPPEVGRVDLRLMLLDQSGVVGSG